MTRYALLLSLACVTATPVSGQSLFGAVGLGLPVEAVDGRARSLGGMGLGLPGVSLLPTDPAAAARARIPSAVLVAQPIWGNATVGERSNSFQGTRFPLLAAGYPILGGVAVIQFTSHMDQDYTGLYEFDASVGGETVLVRDSFTQSGSVSSVNLGYARMLTQDVSAGVTVGRYTGSLARTLIRTIDPESESSNVLPFETSGSWTYSGWQVTGGVASTLFDVLNLAASATWSTRLDAAASEATEAGGRSFDLPLQLRLGATATLAPGLSLSAGVAHADWSRVQESLRDGVAQATTAFGVGLELSQARLLGRTAPLRIGFRHAGLPFSREGGSSSERIFSGGLGLFLNQTGEVVLASVDLGVERGLRESGTLEEDFWRATLSLRLAGL